MKNRLLVVLAATGMFTTQAMAQEHSNVYIGVGLSDTNIKTQVGINSGTGPQYDDGALGATAFVGYSFNKFIAIEGAMTTTEDVSGGGSFTLLPPPSSPPSASTVTMNGKTDMRAFEVVAKGTLPLGNFELFGRGGIVYGDADYELNFAAVENSTGISSPSKATSSTQDTSFIVGAGVGYRIGRGAIRLQYDYTGLKFQENVDIAITQPVAGTFPQNPTVLDVKTDNPGRLMLSISGYF